MFGFFKKKEDPFSDALPNFIKMFELLDRFMEQQSGLNDKALAMLATHEKTIIALEKRIQKLESQNLKTPTYFGNEDD